MIRYVHPFPRLILVLRSNPQHQGESELFNHPAFQSIIIEEFYGEQGIARLVPGTFKHLDVFPEPAMALVRFLVRT